MFLLSILGRRSQCSATTGNAMPDDKSIELKIQRLKTAKSAYILEADSSLARGLERLNGVVRQGGGIGLISPLCLRTGGRGKPSSEPPQRGILLFASPAISTRAKS